LLLGAGNAEKLQWVHEELQRRGIRGPEDVDAHANEGRARDHDVVEEEDPVEIVAMVKACAKQKDLRKGIAIHARIIEKGLLRSDAYVGSSVVSMYAKCGQMRKAEEVFRMLPAPDVVAWNSIIAGYAHRGGRFEEAFDAYKRMRAKGISPSGATIVSILKACAGARSLSKGREIHGDVARGGWMKKHVSIGTALLDMYAKCGALSRAREVFDDVPYQDSVAWNALIGGYSQHGRGEEALECYREMRRKGFSPTPATFVCALKACGNLGSMDLGREIHAEAAEKGLVKSNVLLGTALVDMYAKCGALARARRVFDGLADRDLVAWNALLAGYAQLGRSEAVADAFPEMIAQGSEPDGFTFCILLNTCSHSGLLDGGRMCFERMEPCYGVIPTLEHCTCIVDLFCRAGSFDESIAVIRDMPFCADLTLWLTLLGACRKWGNVNVGILAFDKAIRLDATDASAYLLMHSIYRGAGMHEHASNIERMRVENEAWKTVRHCSWDV
jgi:pentatricopeptide repeat protein